MQKEDQLINRLKSGDASALEPIMLQYQDYVYSILMQMLHPHEADEAAQDSFLKMYRSIHSFNGQSKLSTWLYAITYRTGLDYLKKRKIKEDINDHVHDSSLSVIEEAPYIIEGQEKSGAINRLLQELKPEDAALIRMFYLEELNLKEICKITHQSESNIKVRLFRCRKQLKD